MADRWLNREAMEWVLFESGSDAEQRFTLLAIALHTDREGRGAYPAQALVAHMTGRSRRKTTEDLGALLKRGLLLPGDWRLVVHVRSDRRPNVYDLPDEYREWLGARGAGSAPRKPKRRAEPAPRADRGSGLRGAGNDMNGVQSTTERGAEPAHKEFIKNSGRGERADAQPSAASDTPPDEQPLTPPWPPARTKPPAPAEEILRAAGLRRSQRGGDEPKDSGATAPVTAPAKEATK